MAFSYGKWGFPAELDQAAVMEAEQEASSLGAATAKIEAMAPTVDVVVPHVPGSAAGSAASAALSFRLSFAASGLHVSAVAAKAKLSDAAQNVIRLVSLLQTSVRFV